MIDGLKYDTWVLKRKYLKEGYTVGVLSLDGETRFCDTLEDKVRDFGINGDGKVYGETAIPYGDYVIKSYNSPKFGKVLPLLVGVKGFTYILIHSGNNARHTEGCILVGDNARAGHLVNGGYYQRKLVDRLLRNEEDGIITLIRII